jgi:ketosteroid isomerase-like protein
MKHRPAVLRLLAFFAAPTTSGTQRIARRRSKKPGSRRFHDGREVESQALRDTVRAMSQENVEMVLSQFELWNKGEDMDAIARYYHPNVIVEAPEGWPEGSVSRGFDAWKQQALRLRDTWDEARTEVDEIRSVGRDRVVAQIRYATVGKGTGMASETPMAVAFTFAEGKITRAEYFWEMQALEAAGLSD